MDLNVWFRAFGIDRFYSVCMMRILLVVKARQLPPQSVADPFKQRFVDGPAALFGGQLVIWLRYVHLAAR
ncbi:MAG: hypothetical protein A3J52_03905 [Omnitrophica bacterium RIFCSPHIGHO2_02_FULL_49_9]|nr:MAG: hypothetical protein A3J52_03905 [Omnitrophica bacterium RIFCSPHIGHO2_02_FULL_49_9]